MHGVSKSEFPIESNIKLVHNAYASRACVSNHFQSLLPSCMKRFTTKGEQLPCHNFQKSS